MSRAASAQAAEPLAAADATTPRGNWPVLFAELLMGSESAFIRRAAELNR